MINESSRESRELTLLTGMAEALESALDPSLFFEQTMGVLASELGMIRGTLVLLDRTSRKLKIAAAHGLTADERSRGEYEVGEGVTGYVAQSGVPQIIPDISKDTRFLHRTAARKHEPSQTVAFICVPLRLDGEVIGALSVDRLSATEIELQNDLRLLSIVGSVVSQALKINRLMRVDKEEIIARNEAVLTELRERYQLDNVIGESANMQQILATSATAAKSKATILVTGETGTGKELIANVIHYNSDRAAGPFVKVNCGALPETLLESELFGHVKGSFTGALRDRKGRFELADGGTLFLDEISETSPRLQVKLLRVLQEGEFEPVGAPRTVRVDVRLVAATNKNLPNLIRNGEFREDLYYRLNVIPIHLPPLRERLDDIPPLADYFLDKYNSLNGKDVSRMTREVLDLLLQYSWPGNVRELENCMERAVVMSPGDTLSPDLLSDEIRSPDSRTTPRSPASQRSADIEIRTAVQRFCDTSETLADARESLLALVEETVIRKGVSLGISQRELAKRLNISRMTLRKRMEQYGIQ